MLVCRYVFKKVEIQPLESITEDPPLPEQEKLNRRSVDRPFFQQTLSGFQSPRKLSTFVQKVTLNAPVCVNMNEASQVAGLAPPNFAEVVPGIYRSSFPKEEHFEHLKRLKLTSILTLVPEDYPAENVAFMKENGIKHFQVHIPGNKETANISAENIQAALKYVLDRRNLPILIHCNKGKHRTGCVVACFRKMQNWIIPEVIQEYRKHADPKARPVDEQFIAEFDHSPLVAIACEGGFTKRLHPAAGVALPGDQDFLPAPASPTLSPAIRG